MVGAEKPAGKPAKHARDRQIKLGVSVETGAVEHARFAIHTAGITGPQVTMQQRGSYLQIGREHERNFPLKLGPLRVKSLIVVGLNLIQLVLYPLLAVKLHPIMVPFVVEWEKTAACCCTKAKL